VSLCLQRQRGCEPACSSALREALRRKTLRGIRRGQFGSMSCRSLHLRKRAVIIAEKTWTARHI
jgi:hypothetical protein